MLAELSVVMVSVASPEEADVLAQELVNRRLAACVQAMPIRSTYSWEGELRRDDEVLVLVKTAADRVDDVRAAVTEIHDYEVPEVLVVPVTDADPPYARWVVEATRAAESGAG